MRWSNFTYLARKGVRSVWYNRLMSFASFCVLMVSLLLLGLAALTGLNINILLNYFENQNEISVFVDTKLDDSGIRLIREQIDAHSNVPPAGVVFVSKEEAWENYKQSDPSGQPIYERMPYNPMPDGFKVTIKDLNELQATKADFFNIDGVINVRASDDFAKIFINIRNTLTIVGGAVILALIIVCIVIIYNSARASVFSRRQEINIMKYVGATNAFVRFPFFIEGMFVGIVSGAASWGLTGIAYNSIISIFREDFMLWQALQLGDLVAFSEISWIVLIANCAVGSILSAAGIIMSMGKHLKV